MSEEKRSRKQCNIPQPLSGNQFRDQTSEADQSSQNIKPQEQIPIQLQQSDNQQDQDQFSISKQGGFQSFSYPSSQGRDFENDGLKKNQTREIDTDQIQRDEAENQKNRRPLQRKMSHLNPHQKQFDQTIQNSSCREDLALQQKASPGINKQDIELEAQQSRKLSDKLGSPTEDALKEFSSIIDFEKDQKFEQEKRMLLKLWDFNNSGFQKVQSSKKRQNNLNNIQGPLCHKALKPLESSTSKQRNQQEKFIDANSTNDKEKTETFQSNDIQVISTNIKSPSENTKKQICERQNIFPEKNLQKSELGLISHLQNEINSFYQLKQIVIQPLQNIEEDSKQTTKISFELFESKSKSREQRQNCCEGKQKQHQSKNQNSENENQIVIQNLQKSPDEPSKKQLYSKNIILSSHVLQQSPSKFSLSEEQQKIVKEGFQVDYCELLYHFFPSFKTSFEFLLIPYLQHEKIKQIMKDRRFNSAKVLELMEISELQTFWKIVFEQNAIQKALLNVSKSSLKIQYSKITYLFKYMFDNKRFDGFYVEKEKLIEAALELKAMRDNQGNRDIDTQQNDKQENNKFSAQKKDFIAQALGRNKFHIENFLYQFKKIILKIVKEGIKGHQIQLSQQIEKRIKQIDKKQGLSMRDCNFLLCRSEFCKIWPQAFQQNLIEKNYTEHLSKRKSIQTSPKRIYQYKIMTVLFQKAYQEGSLPNVYIDQDLLLRLANMIQYETQDPYFEKKSKSYWKDFDCEQFQIKMQQQYLSARTEKVEKKQKQRFKKTSHWKTIIKSESVPTVAIELEEFNNLFRKLKQRMFKKVIEQNSGKGYEDLFKTKYAGKLGRIYKKAFAVIIQETMTKNQINHDTTMQKVLRKCELSSEDYYFVLFHPLLQSKLSSLFSKGSFCSFIRLPEEWQAPQLYKTIFDLSDVFKQTWEKCKAIQPIKGP